MLGSVKENGEAPKDLWPNFNFLKQFFNELFSGSCH